MSYTNALQVFFERLNYKHGLKGYSFMNMTQSELDTVLFDEVIEWMRAEKNTHHEIYELADIMVSCVLELEKLLESKKGTESD